MNLAPAAVAAAAVEVMAAVFPSLFKLIVARLSGDTAAAESAEMDVLEQIAREAEKRRFPNG